MNMNPNASVDLKLLELGLKTLIVEIQADMDNCKNVTAKNAVYNVKKEVEFELGKLAQLIKNQAIDNNARRPQFT